MTLSRWRKVVETPEGTGRVTRGDDLVAKVAYALSVEQEELVARSFSGAPKAVLGQTRHVTGKISVSDGDLGPVQTTEASSGALTLLLEDGRALDFVVVDSDSGDSGYLIRGTEDLRQAEQ